jgi:hypothetical protein
MTSRQQDVLDALKFELGFLELGGYARSVREPRKELSIFQDSPTCPNYAAPTKTHLCEECFLIDFVPPERRGQAVPCHHIPLNDRGETVDSLEGSGDDFKVQRAMREWLRTTIEKMEKAQAKGDPQAQEAEAPFFVF